ncbi:MAG: hypothetical protein ACI4XL_07655 [Bacillus sp. (in: firmicutes)]
MGSREEVVEKTVWLQKDGYCFVKGPGIIGDDYYESVMEDPEDNLLGDRTQM